MIFQFKIQINGVTKPTVWRRITVPIDFTFFRFHDVIQTAFGWDSIHLFEFSDREFINQIRISIPYLNELESEEFFHATRIRLKDIFCDSGQKFIYTYDFSDDWVHCIILENILYEKHRIAHCIGGRGCCPPEDCGGAWGYERIKGILALEPSSEESHEYRRWLDIGDNDQWDAQYFDLEETDRLLRFC